MSRGNPFEEIERIFDRMSRELAGGELDLDMGMGKEVRVDVEDTGEEYVVTADLPGYDREELTVELTGNQLRVGADSEEGLQEDQVVGGDRYIRQERHHTSVSRTVRLPEPVDEEAVEATYTNGVLTVTLPKRGAEDSHSIDIE